MKRFTGTLLLAGILALAGCTKAVWEYQTISGPNDRVLKDPMAQGWEPVGICVTSDGQRWFLLKREKAADHPESNWQYKTLISKTGEEALDAPENQGWDVIGVSDMPDGSKWFLLRKAKTSQKTLVSSAS